LIPNVLAAALGQQQTIRVFGDNYPTPDGTPIRDYIHVVDLADAHILALEYLRAGGNSEFLNLGTGRGYSVLEVIECVREVTGREIPSRIEAPRAGDPARLIADPSKAKALLRWEAAVSDLPSIVRSAWNWRLRHPNGYTSD
jgi:UDP-glucose 4-epimerase